MKNIKLLGACCNYGQRRYGPRVAPCYMEDRLNVQIEKIKENPVTNIFDYDLLYSTHNQNINNNKNIITIGGDHSISYSTINSALQKYGDSLHVIWIDAHSDINTQSTSVTQNLHGMPVAQLMGFEKHPLTTFENHILDPSQLTYIGVRDIDPPEYRRISEHKINCCSFINEKYLLRKLKNKKIYFSIDVDSMDPYIFPCTGTPVADGLFLHEILNIVNTLKENAVGMDIVEFDPLVNKVFNIKCVNQIEKIIKNYSS